MDKELRGLIIEIVSLVLILLIVVPACASASNKYQRQKEVFLTGIDTTVDISTNDNGKVVTIYSNHDEVLKVNLTLKINKFNGEYAVRLDGDEFNIRELECREDEEYRYYNLGIYEVNRVREFDFELRPIETSYYDETISYSFITNGEIWKS